MCQCHALEQGWDLHRLRQDPACLEKPSQALSSPLSPRYPQPVPMPVSSGWWGHPGHLLV